MKQTSKYNYIFDHERFYLQVKIWGMENGLEVRDIAEYLGFSRGYFHTLRNYEPFHPSMGNFLMICNELELNPLDYFTIVRVEGSQETSQQNGWFESSNGLPF